MFNLSKIVGIILAAVLIFSFNPSLPVKADNSPIIINEVNWAGSGLSTSDEWLELKNTTASPIDITNYVINNLGNASTPNITLSTSLCSNLIIPGNSYFLISNSIATSSSTSVKITPDCVTTGISLRNSPSEQLTLRDNDTNILDQTPISSSNWAGGLSASCTGSTRSAFCSSMARLGDGLDGLLTSTWTSSRLVLNNKTSSTAFGFGFGTPGTDNLSTNFCASTFFGFSNDIIVDAGSNCSKVASGGSSDSGYLVFGPYISGNTLLKSNQSYQANFSLRIPTLPTNKLSDLIRIEAVNNNSILKEKTLRLSDFGGSNSYQDFILNFPTPNSNNNSIELRVKVLDSEVDLLIDTINTTQSEAPTSWVYRGSDLPTSAGGVNVEDAGKVIKKGNSNSGYLTFGPYSSEQITGNWYQVTFRVRRDILNSSTPPDLNHVLFDIYNSGPEESINMLQVPYSQLTTEYQDFSVNFLKSTSTGTLEFRTLLNGSGTDIFLDQITVSQTPEPTSYDRTFQSELAPKINGSEVQDSQIIARQSSAVGHAVFGPYVNDLPIGNYQAVFYLKNNGGASGEVINADINSIDSGIIQLQTINSEQLNSTNYTPITINFSRTTLIGKVEFRVFNLNNSNSIRIDRVEVTKL